MDAPPTDGRRHDDAARGRTTQGLPARRHGWAGRAVRL